MVCGASVSLPRAGFGMAASAPRAIVRARVGANGAMRRNIARRADARDAAWHARACGYDPEQKAVETLSRLHTFVAARVCMAQADGQGNECSEDVNVSKITSAFLETLERHPMRDSGSDFIEKLLESADAETRLAAVRLIEVRRAWAEDDFDWEEMKRLALEHIETQRLDMLREHARRSL